MKASENQCVVVLCSCPDGEPAARIARMLVEEGLAACVNRLPGVVSNYCWERRLEEEYETLLLMKTTTGRLSSLTARITALHPYELPEVIAVPVVGGLEQYLAWVRSSVSGPDGLSGEKR
jgi:periplasmic divalent cation tolerance protein